MIKFNIPAPMRGKVDPAPTKKELRDLLLDIRKLILDKTRDGIDADYKPFTRYSPMYIDFKQRQMTRVGDSSHVNLMLTGQMLRSIAVSVSQYAGKLFFSDAERAEIAYAHDSGTGQKKREFFAMAEKDADKFADQLGEQIYKRISKEWVK